jgi:hypothetical protein
MRYVLNSSDLKRVEELKEQMDDTFITNGSFYQLVITESIGIDNLVPEDIYDYIQEINSIDESVLQESQENGSSLISKALGVSRHTATNLMRDPRSASVVFRALRDKLEEQEDRLERTNAEQRGLIASIIYNIKKAILWMIKTFKDIKDDVSDTIHNHPVGAAQAKRDYEWIKNNTDKWMAGNTGWFHIDNDYHGIR